jgi:hypothetical protein
LQGEWAVDDGGTSRRARAPGQGNRMLHAPAALEGLIQG